MAKFGAFDEKGNEIAFSYPNVFFVEPLSRGERLTIGPSSGFIDLMLSLARSWPHEEYYVLYVLLMSHSGAEHARYESPLISSFEDLQLFFYTYQEFFEGDGRHHVWIGSPHQDGTLIYDQHNVIFAYGNSESYRQILLDAKLSEKAFRFPAPHAHHYSPENVEQEEAILKHFEWAKSPLQPHDEY